MYLVKNVVFDDNLWVLDIDNKESDKEYLSCDQIESKFMGFELK